MKTIGTRQLPPVGPGISRSLSIVRYGKNGRRPKAYLQAGLHAEEAPSYVVLHYLQERLDQAEGRGDIVGEVVIVPAANPIGLGQWHYDRLQGRFHACNAVNFNRGHLELTHRIASEIGPYLGADSAKNIKIIRSCTRKLLDTITPVDDDAYLKKLLFSLAHDADIVLDLHCDNQALMHMYFGSVFWPDAVDLPAQMGAHVTLLAADSGGTPFDEAVGKLWWELAERFPHHPIPPACLSATLEFRGICDTDHETATHDADNLFYFLQRRGVINGTAPPLPPLLNKATPLTGVDFIKAPAPGIIIFRKEVGDRIRKGETVAEIINPLPEREHNRVCPVKSVTDGLLFTQIADRLAKPGRIIAKVAGSTPLRAVDEDLLTL